MQPDEKGLEFRNKVIEMVNVGQIATAMPLLRVYLNSYPDDLVALIWLAACVSPAETVPLLDRILKLQPDVLFAKAWRTQCLRLATTQPVKPALPEEVEPPVVVAPATETTVEVEAEAAAPSVAPDRASDDEPVSLSDLIPDFQSLPDSTLLIPPPPPAHLQVEPLPLLDPTEWVSRATSETRQSREFTPEATAQIFKLVDFLNKLPWQDAVKTPDGYFLEQPEERELYNRGIELARGWNGDPNKLIEAAQLFCRCRPPLGFAGAAEVLVSASYVRERVYNPLGLVYSVFWADRALELDPFNVDGLIARSEATTRSQWRLLADITVDRLRLLAPRHPRRYAVDGWYEYLSGNRPRAIELLYLAIEEALTPVEKGLCSRLLGIVQPAG